MKGVVGSAVGQGPWDVEEDPFLADLLWWKGEQVAVVEVSVQVDGEDVARAGRRADILRQAWAPEAREQALARQVEWKVGPDLSAGLLAFRWRAGHKTIEYFDDLLTDTNGA